MPLILRSFSLLRSLHPYPSIRTYLIGLTALIFFSFVLFLYIDTDWFSLPFISFECWSSRRVKSRKIRNSLNISSSSRYLLLYSCPAVFSTSVDGTSVKLPARSSSSSALRIFSSYAAKAPFSLTNLPEKNKRLKARSDYQTYPWRFF